MAVVAAPRLRIEVAGQTMAVESASVTLTGYFHAASAKAKLPLWTADQPQGDAFWLGLGTDGKPIPFRVFTGTADASDAVTWNSDPLFDGELETKTLTLDSYCIEIEGHDLTMRLIKDKTKHAWANQSAAEIIKQHAANNGLTVEIDGGDQLAGRIYSANHLKLIKGELSKTTTAWDEICLLARETGNVAYVRGTVLHITPNRPDPGAAYKIKWSRPVLQGGVFAQAATSTVSKLSVTHNLLASKDITVKVYGFHQKKGVRFAATAGPVKSRTNAAQDNYEFGPYANLTPAQAQDKADQLYRDLTIHEYDVGFEAPADFSLTPYQTVIIDGADGPMAQSFWVHEVEFTADQSSGAVMAVKCKNHPAQNDTNV